MVDRGATKTAVLMGVDAMRICMNMPPANYSPDEVRRWFCAMLEKQAAPNTGKET